MASFELGEKKKFVPCTGIFIGFLMILFVVSVFIFCFAFFLPNSNAPSIYYFDFLFLKFSQYSTFVKKSIIKFDIYSNSFINCIPKVLLVISDIVMSRLVFYLFKIGMTQLIYHLFNKNEGGFKTHFTFSMELFMTLPHGFQMVNVVAKSYLIDGARFIDLFSEKDIVKI